MAFAGSVPGGKISLLPEAFTSAFAHADGAGERCGSIKGKF